MQSHGRFAQWGRYVAKERYAAAVAVYGHESVEQGVQSGWCGEKDAKVGADASSVTARIEREAMLKFTLMSSNELSLPWSLREAI